MVTLGAIGPAAIARQSPMLIDTMETATGKSRNTAVYALSKIGSKKALPLIKKYAASSSLKIARFHLVCAWALRQSQSSAIPATVKAALPGLIKVLAEENPACFAAKPPMRSPLAGPLAESAAPRPYQ